MERKKKFKHDYGIKNVYQFYKKTYNEPIDYKMFVKVIKKFNSEMVQQMYRGAYMSLPHNLGDLFIYKYKPKYKFDADGNISTEGKFKMVDYKATKKLWEEYPELAHKQRVFYDNFHSDGYKVAISWKRYHTLRAHKLYNFMPARSFSRGLAAYFRNNPNQDYYDK